MRSEPLVRDATPHDQAAMGRLGALLVTEHHDFDRERFIAPLPQLAERYGAFLVSQIDRPEMVVLVAEVDLRVVAYVYAGLEGNDYMALRGPAGVIYDLVVDAAHRRQGIGNKLLSAALHELHRLGAPRALLFTAEKNRAARALFERSGFRPTMIEMTRELESD